MDLFKEINRQMGVLVMIITHDPRIALQCTRRVVLRQGLVVPDDETEAELSSIEATRLGLSSSAAH